jgi:nucleoside-diphosphate-sugar epimerase
VIGVPDATTERVRQRILVIGAGGYLGAHLRARLARDAKGEVVGTCRPQSPVVGLSPMDLTDPMATFRALGALRPDVVVWCASVGARQPWPQREREESRLLAGLDTVLEALDQTGQLIYVSSDGVLPGVGGPHDESCVPVPMAPSVPMAA